MVEIIRVAIATTIILFIVGVIFGIYTLLVGGFVHPLFDSLEPEPGDPFADEYLESTKKLDNSGRLFFYILIGALFFSLIGYFIFFRESTVVAT